MTKILIAWELGSGLGHVGPLRAVGSELVRRGHDVTIGAQNVGLCQQAFAGTRVEVISAPVLPLSDKRLKFPCTYSDTLHDCGHSSAEQLAAAVDRWLQLFDEFAPDFLLADHSPTALLAARLRDFPVATIGTGFVCPPDITPLPSLRSEIPAPHWAAEVEGTVLANMNAVLASRGRPSLGRVTQIFGAAEQQYLLTFPVLDHYLRWRADDSRESSFWAPIGNFPGQPCDWPSSDDIQPRPRLFVYLRDNAALLPILRGLAYKEYPTIAYGPRLTEDDEASFCGSSVHVVRTPVDLSSITARCDLAVLHGGHGTVCEFLRRGVPMLVLPMSLEQRTTGERLIELGVGAWATPADFDAVGESLEGLIGDENYRHQAHRLAERINQPGDGGLNELVDRIVAEL
jgi:UDP:flavonoid glycosyltransferase YjiC (YdhE family)